MQGLLGNQIGLNQQPACDEIRAIRQELLDKASKDNELPKVQNKAYWEKLKTKLNKQYENLYSDVKSNASYVDAVNNEIFDESLLYKYFSTNITDEYLEYSYKINNESIK